MKLNKSRTSLIRLAPINKSKTKKHKKPAKVVPEYLNRIIQEINEMKAKSSIKPKQTHQPHRRVPHKISSSNITNISFRKNSGISSSDFQTRTQSVVDSREDRVIQNTNSFVYFQLQSMNK